MDRVLGRLDFKDNCWDGHRSFFVCYAATQLALQVQQEQSLVVCSNREAQKRPARGHSHNGPWTQVHFFEVIQTGPWPSF